MTMVATEERVIALPHRPDSGFDLHAAWRDHGRALLGFATVTLGDQHAAEDCVQETFLRAWRAQDRFAEQRGSVRTWLFAIARNVTVDQMRARARRPSPVADEGVARLLPPQREAQPGVEARMVIVEALATLSAEHREVLVAVRLEGLSYAELAERTGVPVATLRTRCYHALRALRAILLEEDPHHAHHW